MSIDFHRLIEPIDINRLIFIDYIDYIDCFPMIDFHRLATPGDYTGPDSHEKKLKLDKMSGAKEQNLSPTKTSIKYPKAFDRHVKL